MLIGIEVDAIDAARRSHRPSVEEPTTESCGDLTVSGGEPLARQNAEHERQFTQEFRFQSPGDAKITILPVLTARWLAGLFIFDSSYQEDAFNAYHEIAAIGAGAPTPFKEQNLAELDDFGVGVFAQTTLTAVEKLDLTLGLRYDFEHDVAQLDSFTTPPVEAAAIGPPRSLAPSSDFDQFTPQFALDYRIVPGLMPYALIARGFKAGGFNANAPRGAESFGRETSWSYEAGLKARLAENVNASLAGFYTDWNNLQLDVPNPLIPARFYTANAGQARSRGVEIALDARPLPGWSLFAGFGYTHAMFGAGSNAEGEAVGGNTLPFAPDLNWNAGTEIEQAVGPVTAYARAEAYGYGRFFYDATNAASQSSYELVDFHLGAGGATPVAWRLDGWIKNALNTDYVPLAFPFPSLAPSGYVGESGAPRTFGVTLTIGL